MGHDQNLDIFTNTSVILVFHQIGRENIVFFEDDNYKCQNFLMGGKR